MYFKYTPAHFVIVVLISILPACSESSKGSPTDDATVDDASDATDKKDDTASAVNSDTDTDSDTDADSDADMDSDADTDSDTDTDSDADTDSDTDTDSDADTDADADADADSDADTDGDTDSALADTTDSGASTDTNPEPLTIITSLPTGFVRADEADTDSSYGGVSVVGALDENAVHDEDAVCANIIRVVMRDFVKDHGDFQDDWTNSAVAAQLGDDRKPVAADGNNTQIETEWYRNIQGVNMPLAVDLWLEPVGDTFVFDSKNFFPLDNAGFDERYSCCEDEGCPHNYHFTTEMHAKFQYNGGEVFTFIGDDDVYVYINDQLVIDLGGVHGPEEASVVLDDVAGQLSLQIGEVYPIDFFQAERQWCGSTFRIETTLDFSGCSIILPSDIILE